MKTKMQKYKNTRNWARGCKKEKRGCQKQPGQAQPKTSSSTSGFSKNAHMPCTNYQIQYTSSIAKTHNIKLVENFKTIPTI